MTADTPPAFVCAMTPPAYVHDADTIRCADGTRIRVAGIDAPDFTTAEPCRQHRPGYVCDDRKAAAAQRIAERMVLGKTLTCEPVGTSSRRVVARCQLPDGRDLSCELLSAGAADVWPSYWRRYRMGECR